MSAALLRKARITTWQLRRCSVADVADPILRPTHSRALYRSPYFLGKSNKFEVIRPHSFVSRFCYSSSSATAPLSKVGFVGWYLSMVKSRPVLTKSITSSLIYVAADLSSQTIAQASSDSYDLFRTARMAGYGLFILGPTIHYWFNFMSRLFPKRDLLMTFNKMALGQTIYGPCMTAIFFSLNAHLQGESGSEIISRLKRDLFPTLLNGVMYWPFCDFITFRFFPVHLQPLVSNSFSYLWTIYMTYMASREKANTISD